MKKQIFAVDFDGTCTTHDYPKIGKDIGAIDVLKKLVRHGHKLILFTMRDKEQLQEAKDWFKENHIDLWAAQKNPGQWRWTTSIKPYAHIYIDDAALGCPLIENKEMSDRPFVDWKKVEEMLVSKEII